MIKVGEFRLKLYPKDFEASRVFYKDTLGFPVTKEWDRGPGDQGVMFEVGSTTLELLSFEGEHEAYGGTGLSLEVENVTELAEQLKGKCTITHGLRHNAWGDTSFGIEDPEGYKISFFTKD